MRIVTEQALTWTQPRRVDVWWWMQTRLHDPDRSECVTREGTVTWNQSGAGHYGVFISYEREGIGMHCWPDFYALSDAQDFIERLMRMTVDEARAIHGTQWPGVVL